MIRALLATLAATACFTSVACLAAQAGPAAEAAYFDAGNKYAALIGRASAAHDPAIVEAGEGPALVAALTDESLFLKPGPYAYSPDEVVRLGRLCAPSVRAAFLLMQFDSPYDLTPPPNDAPFAPKQLEIVMRNLHAFSGPLTRLQPFSIRCNARFQHAVETSDPKLLNPTLVNVMPQAVLGDTQSFDSVLSFISSGVVDDTLLAALLQAHAETASAQAQIMPLRVRARLLDRIESVMIVAPERYLPHLKAMKDAMSDLRCGWVCKMVTR